MMSSASKNIFLNSNISAIGRLDPLSSVSVIRTHYVSCIIYRGIGHPFARRLDLDLLHLPGQRGLESVTLG